MQSGTCWQRNVATVSESACSLGGYDQEELGRAGAMRAYADPADLLDHLNEVGAGGSSGAEAQRSAIHESFTPPVT